MTQPIDYATADVMRDVLGFLDAMADADVAALRVILRNTKLPDFVESMAALTTVLIVAPFGLDGNSPIEEVVACVHDFTAGHRSMLAQAGEHG